ncbi:MAG: ABC transporter substrate-binding protein, partial [Acidimicrobiaceae bacterium]|nr:ABC transporter substrate-binding protein [Acidimicrobiaceae bacterium]
MRLSGSVLGIVLAWLLLAACSGEAAGPSGSDPFDGTVRIGATFSETGKFSVEGKDTRQGYDTWLTWVNENYGGIRIGDQRYRAEIVYYDDESDADTAG